MNCNKPVLTVILFVSMIISSPSVFASSLMWSNTYGGSGMDISVALVQTSDGGYAMAGLTYSDTDGDSDALLIKTNEYGEMQWNKTIGGPDNYSAYSLIQTNDGGFAFVGTNASYYSGYIPIGTMPEGAWSFIWLVKIDQIGNIEWSQTFDFESGYYYGSSLIQTTDGGYALSGHFFYDNQEDADIILIKTDSLGNMEWTKSYGSSGGESDPSGLIQTSDGGFAFVCKRFPIGEVYVDAWFLKTDEFGTMQWNQTFGGARMDYPTSLIELSDGKFVLAGCTDSYGYGGYDFWLIKTDNFGNLEWDLMYGTPNMDTNPDLVQTLDGGFALAGYTDHDSFADFLLIKTDNQGSMEWNQTIPGQAVLGLPSLVQTFDGGYALSGSKGSFESEDWDFWLIKTDEMGNIPEFSSWIIQPLFLISTLSVIVVRRKFFT